MSKEAVLYRMNIKPNSEIGLNPFEFCKENKIVGFGWALLDEDNKRIIPENIDECERLGRKQYISDNHFVRSIKACKRLEINDLIWTRNNGIYYLCRVTGPWMYLSSETNYKHDILNALPVEFVKVGTIEMVPGKVVNSFRVPSVLQRVCGDSLLASKVIYNQLVGIDFYDVKSDKKADLFDMLQAEDIEEIVSLYLQVSKDYLVYTSTNKLDTAKYEFVGVSRDGSHKCYPQVKSGHEKLDFNDFDMLTEEGNKVYLFATSQNYIKNDNTNIVALTREEISKFINNNKAIVPDRIKKWLENSR